MNVTPIQIELSEEERLVLTRLSRSQTAPHRAVVRATSVLLLADGHSLSSIALKVGRQRSIVRTWAQRFLKRRLEGLKDEPRSGRPPAFSPRGGLASHQAGLRAP